MRRPCWVYRVYDAGDTLLYVGSTVDLEVRLRHHSRHAPWWPFQSTIKAKVYNELEARRVEREAIINEHPRWNVKDRSPQHPDGLCGTGAINAPHLREEVELWRAWLRAEVDHRRTRVQLAALNDRMAEIVADRSPHFAETATVNERKRVAIQALHEGGAA